MSDATSTKAFEIDDVGDLNASLQAYVRQLSPLDITDRMDEITIPTFGDESSLPKAQEILRKFGIVIFGQAANKELCDVAAQAVSRLYARYASSGELVVEDEEVLYQIGSSKLKGYYQLSNYPKSVVTVRQGADQGMVDIFNADFALQDELGPLKTLFESDYVRRLIGGNSTLTTHNFNSYINDSIRATRGFHVDSYAEHLKAFIYLSDVTDLDDGPYTYVKGSHLESSFRRANKSLCGDLKPATETPLVNPLAITPIVAPKGSLVISDQAGSHRGWPQASKRCRMAAVMKYAR